MRFCEEKDLALCGLACVLCSTDDCPGCKTRGRKDGYDCPVYKCATKKGIDGCYQCSDFPCNEDMLQGIRNRAFNQYARQFSKKDLLTRLRTNYEDGVAYHRSDGMKGDYDLLETEDDIFRLIRFGSYSPYKRCPILETEHFILRLVQLEDAEDLLKCYSDPNAQQLFNADRCLNDFCYQTLEEMQNCIAFWLKEYEQEAYVRFAIVDKSRGKAVGTIEMFGMIGQYKVPQGVLRLDICFEYECVSLIKELLMLCSTDFFMLFGVVQIVTKADTIASCRIQVLKELGFSSCEFPERTHSWCLDKTKV